FGLDQPPVLAVGRLGFPPSEIRSPRSGPRRNRFGSNLAGGRSAGRHRTPATRCLNTRPLGLPTAARALRAAPRPPRWRAAICTHASSCQPRLESIVLAKTSIKGERVPHLLHDRCPNRVQ